MAEVLNRKEWLGYKEAWRRKNRARDCTWNARRGREDREGSAYAGLLAKDVRRVMRRVEGCLIRPSTVASILGLSKSRARRILNGLEQEGLVAAKDDFWEITAKGRSLTMATAATPLRRATAESLITKLIERAKMINDSNHLAYRVQRLVVFGSVARGAERPNDVDVACSLVPRFQGDRQRVVEEARRGEKRSFANTSEWAVWPKLEVLKILKSRSRGTTTTPSML
jgi:DNA-binding MarR family transcriptional regulator